jgi:hypothetical protein
MDIHVSSLSWFFEVFDNRTGCGPYVLRTLSGTASGTFRRDAMDKPPSDGYPERKAISGMMDGGYQKEKFYG